MVDESGGPNSAAVVSEVDSMRRVELSIHEKSGAQKLTP